MRINWPVFYNELKSKERETGLKLLVTGVGCGDPRYSESGLDPLPADLTPAQVTVINEVVAVHDPTKPDKVAVNTGIQAQIDALEKGQGRPLREAAIGTVGAVDRLRSLDGQITALRAQLRPYEQ